MTALSTGYGLDVEEAAAFGSAGLITAASLLGATVLASVVRLLVRCRPRRASSRWRQCLLLAGLVTAMAAALAGGAAGPGFGAERSGLAVLLLAGWLGLTVLGSLLHLLSVLVQVRVPSRAHLPPHGDGSGAVAALACVGLVGLTVGLLLPLGALVLPAALALGAAYAFLLARVVVLAGRALAHGGIRV